MEQLPLAQFERLFPSLSATRAALYFPCFQAANERFAINTPKRLAVYVAQLGHESLDLQRWVENLSYTAQRLRLVWPKRFPTMQIAMEYARQPEKLANYVYANRMGNNDDGDGYKYRGRGPLQATGKDMYAWLSKQLGTDYVANPDLVATPEHGFLAAAAIYVNEKHCNELADQGTEQAFVEITRRINGGDTGLQDRKDRWARARRILGV